jgi:serine/threonine-protein kinase HipA
MTSGSSNTATCRSKEWSNSASPSSRRKISPYTSQPKPPDDDPRPNPKLHHLDGRDLTDSLRKGLLPEEDQRTAIARALGVSPDNPFRLLAALGGDVAGALSFLPAGEAPTRPLGDRVPLAALSEEELTATLDRLPYTPMLAGEGLARLSLAGAQSKLPVRLVEGEIALARDHMPSTHLIKPEPERFAGLAANEGFCLALARAIGLDAAHAQWRKVGQRPFLLVTRYDRETAGGHLHLPLVKSPGS